MTDTELHDALFRHALTEQGWAGPGADLTGVPLRRMLDVEDVYRGAHQLHVDPRAVAAIYVAFNYEGERTMSRPVVIANGQAICVVRLAKGDGCCD